MEKIGLVKEIRGINTYRNVVDVDFTEFVKPVATPTIVSLDVNDLFRLYNQLFYDIPITGTNSHTTLAERSSQYLGTEVIDEEKRALIEEINTLKQQIIDLSETYLTISNITK
jgi:hypothetical protein